MVVGHGDRSGVEGVGLKNVCACGEILVVNFADDLWARQREQVIITAQVAFPGGEAITTVFKLGQPVTLDHGAHGTIEHKDALRQRLQQCSRPCGAS